MIAETNTDLYKIYNFIFKNINFPSLTRWIEKNNITNIDINNNNRLHQIFKDFISSYKQKKDSYPKDETENIYQWYNRIKNYNYYLIIQNPAKNDLRFAELTCKT